MRPVSGRSSRGRTGRQPINRHVHHLQRGKPGIDGGVGDIFEVADACLFLASDQSRHVSGVELYVDGGASLLK
jgi:NAD(P)-dependent dehydrogenase (short-subunit alcohol dehydrogenase family)